MCVARARFCTFHFTVLPVHIIRVYMNVIITYFFRLYARCICICMLLHMFRTSVFAGLGLGLAGLCWVWLYVFYCEHKARSLARICERARRRACENLAAVGPGQTDYESRYRSNLWLCARLCSVRMRACFCVVCMSRVRVTRICLYTRVHKPNTRNRCTR